MDRKFKPISGKTEVVEAWKDYVSNLPGNLPLAEHLRIALERYQRDTQNGLTPEGMEACGFPVSKAV